MNILMLLLKWSPSRKTQSTKPNWHTMIKLICLQSFWISSKWTDMARYDVSSAYDKGSSLQFDTREKATPVWGQIITNEMKLTQDKPAKCKVSLK